MKNLTFVLLLCIAACSNDTDEINRITNEAKSPTETINGLQILYSDSGFVKASMKAAVMNRYYNDTPYTELPKGVAMYFFDIGQDTISTLTAKYAIRNEINKTMEARNDVIVKNKKGETLNTEKLVWNEATGKFTSDVFVKITTASEVIMGQGFEANQDFTRYSIKKPKGSIIVNKSDSTAPAF
ncbi:MAG: LPS export ABC transporter periplasmic protein LptC [Bacteroidia bacterium]|nr:LPS export ABC transporter periplasmic protein LptC [Bacteroidia bacterium]